MADVEAMLNTNVLKDDLYASIGVSLGGLSTDDFSRLSTVSGYNSGSTVFKAIDQKTGAYIYTYAGSEGRDVINVYQSIGGTARTQNNRAEMEINTGNNDDIIAVGMDIGRSYGSGYTDKKHFINMEEGDDLLIVGLGNTSSKLYADINGNIGVLDDLAVITEPGNRLLNIEYGKYDSGSGGKIQSTTINMGDGNDRLLVMGYEDNSPSIINADIDLGQGDDYIYINGSPESSNIKGGDGRDTLHINNSTISTDQFSGFEVIILGDGYTGKQGEVTLDIGALKDISDNKLYIQGNGDSKVMLQGGGSWIDSAIDTEIEGVTYDKYINTSNVDLGVYIEHDVKVVI
ncbi:TPA: hypothetical protein PBQ16_005237 [Escherichia coli]|nr:hypothetical protein [Escherichia coli]